MQFYIYSDFAFKWFLYFPNHDCISHKCDFIIFLTPKVLNRLKLAVKLTIKKYVISSDVANNSQTPSLFNILCHKVGIFMAPEFNRTHHRKLSKSHIINMLWVKMQHCQICLKKFFPANLIWTHSFRWRLMSDDVWQEQLYFRCLILFWPLEPCWAQTMASC